MNLRTHYVRITPDVSGFMRAVNRLQGQLIARQIDHLIALAQKAVVTAAELTQRLAHDLTPWGTIRLAKEIR